MANVENHPYSSWLIKEYRVEKIDGSEIWEDVLFECRWNTNFIIMTVEDEFHRMYGPVEGRISDDDFPFICRNMLDDYLYEHDSKEVENEDDDDDY